MGEPIKKTEVTDEEFDKDLKEALESNDIDGILKELDEEVERYMASDEYKAEQEELSKAVTIEDARKIYKKYHPNIPFGEM